MSVDRRLMLAALAGAGALPLLAAQEESGGRPPQAARTGARRELALLLYPGMTALDLLGPYHFLGFVAGARIHLVTNQPELGVVTSDAGVGIVATTTMDGCPRDLDLVLVPGGTDGTIRAARDPRTLAFLRDRSARARFVSSVCTGSVVLGAAGLLRGRRATSHWTVVDDLARFGAIPVHERVVEDGNLVTAAGVSPGLDSGIVLAERLVDRHLAEFAVLTSEYAPKPPLAGGSVATASPEIAREIRRDLRGFVDEVRALRPAEDSIR